jgi:DNA-binding NarL/FixJ family response regulator
VRQEAVQAGADLFLHKTATGEQILNAIAAVMTTIPERSRVSAAGRSPVF